MVKNVEADQDGREDVLRQRITLAQKKIGRELTQKKRGSELLRFQIRVIRVHLRLNSVLLQFLLAVGCAEAHLVTEEIQQ
jgi:hypothetical protein